MALGIVGFAELLVTGASWVLAASLAWLALLLLAAVVEQLAAGRLHPLRWVGCPAAWRPAVLVAVSALLALPAAPASAGPGWLPAPERTRDAPTTGVRAGEARPAAAPAADHLVVRAGDSLWSLARDLLPRADDGELLALVTRLHAANRDLLRANPDLIHPGQRLRLPPDPTGAP